MILKYAAKRNTYGNTYTMQVDTESKTFKKGYFLSMSTSDHIPTTQKAINNLADELKANGFKELH